MCALAVFLSTLWHCAARYYNSCATRILVITSRYIVLRFATTSISIYCRAAHRVVGNLNNLHINIYAFSRILAAANVGLARCAYTHRLGYPTKDETSNVTTKAICDSHNISHCDAYRHIDIVVYWIKSILLRAYISALQLCVARI